ncbi:FAD-dependent oxidoreductase [Pimelobacter simplex]|uniref:Cyclohexanone monooxygenase n=1 Tax=Nocardioides simplex TaxID=2045 RepID=A0A0A1DNP8_NOCSI|nr:NAD(P)/FAD-dependent oxidoreductase [Pimelobacter simplex]AIY18277.1 Cyclohexanone monooxygenase [Pimelobacter simplex]MCG8153426.1 FAD-dependent oxidoreductase [Pimelobacter simplex]GEB15904.1 putative monooxygenase [Pimelobacter simplex]SFN12607.1 Predicted flavoprotein CzcO associated with the cation diffusion facilitator CzcD [Pimelobacter simplex]
MNQIHDAVIVGAGFGGMGAAIELHRQGYDDLVILEREDDLGGTWHVNRYPGLAVDIPSSTYSYSFEPNPHWSRLFAPGAELKKYAGHVADKYGLRRHMRFGTVVEGARWDEDAAAWEVTLAGGEVVRGRFLLTATGFLSQPKLPDIPGVEDFAGTVVHTTRWDDDIELAGKRVGIIGTGATAVQLIPELAKVADHLTVYQRTPIYVSPKLDGPVPGVVRGAFAKVPLTQKATRLVGTSILEVMMVAGVLHFRDLPWANAAGKRVCAAHLARQVKDPVLRAKLTPDYDFGCKRPTFSNTYYPTFTKPHVDLETIAIDHVDAGGIVTSDGNRTDLDVLVLATGFNLWDVNFPAIQVVGREGRDLGKWWRDNRFCAYEGITVPKFPNFFSLNSPYSYSGLSYFTTIETQMAHMGRVLGAMRQRGADIVEVTEEANDQFLDRMTGLLDNSVFNAGSCSTARSYYFNQHGEAVLLRPTSTLSAAREATRFPLDHYTFTGARVSASAS